MTRKNVGSPERIVDMTPRQYKKMALELLEKGDVRLKAGNHEAATAHYLAAQIYLALSQEPDQRAKPKNPDPELLFTSDDESD